MNNDLIGSMSQAFSSGNYHFSKIDTNLLLITRIDPLSMHIVFTDSFVSMATATTSSRTKKTQTSGLW